jgi:hypothetical protein
VLIRMRTLTVAELTALRRIPGRSALLYLTDRCPIGCAHCSVAARRGGPPVAGWPQFAALVAALGQVRGLDLVGLSGGEPFAERRGLCLAVERLTEAGKLVVPYTSGYWGTSDDVPGWITTVIRRSSCVVLSTDKYHAARIPGRAVIAAARAIAAAGRPIACQVIDEPAQLDAAAGLLAQALGERWTDQAELVPIPLLPAGRAAGLPEAAASRPAEAVRGRCLLARSPVIRYDGRVTACCNETVITGGGPRHLHRRAVGADLAAALGGLAADAYLTVISSLGIGALTALPGYQAAAGSGHICRACWQLIDLGAAADPLVAALALPGWPGRVGQGPAEHAAEAAVT